MDTPIIGIDCHAHVTRRGTALDPLRHSEPEVDVEAADFLAVLEQHGLSHGVLTAPSFYGLDNSLLLEALQQSGGRLRGVVNVDPDVDRQLLRQWHDWGVTGVRFNLLKRNPVPDFSDHRHQALFEFLRSLGWHVELYIESNRFESVAAPLLQSGVRIVLDHFGSPIEADGRAGRGYRAVLKAVERGDVWAKLSAPYRFPSQSLSALTDALISAGGTRCLVWGSDWPWVSFSRELQYQDCLRWLEDCCPDSQLRQQILTENPRIPFRF
jgi:predicted TIM-barrel fold metal-dependent hydrolase